MHVVVVTEFQLCSLTCHLIHPAAVILEETPRERKLTPEPPGGGKPLQPAFRIAGVWNGKAVHLIPKGDQLGVIVKRCFHSVV